MIWVLLIIGYVLVAGVVEWMLDAAGLKPGWGRFLSAGLWLPWAAWIVISLFIGLLFGVTNQGAALYTFWGFATLPHALFHKLFGGKAES